MLVIQYSAVVITADYDNSTVFKPILELAAFSAKRSNV
jgi:hypothetical protein